MNQKFFIAFVASAIVVVSMFVGCVEEGGTPTPAPSTSIVPSHRVGENVTLKSHEKQLLVQVTRVGQVGNTGIIVNLDVQNIGNETVEVVPKNCYLEYGGHKYYPAICDILQESGFRNTGCNKSFSLPPGRGLKLGNCFEFDVLNIYQTSIKFRFEDEEISFAF